MQLFVLLYVIFITVLFDILFPCRLQLHFSIALLYFLPSLSFLCYYNFSYSIFIFILSLLFHCFIQPSPTPSLLYLFSLTRLYSTSPSYSLFLHSPSYPIQLSLFPFSTFLHLPVLSLSIISISISILFYLHLSLLSYPILSPLLLHFPTPP